MGFPNSILIANSLHNYHSTFKGGIPITIMFIHYLINSIFEKKKENCCWYIKELHMFVE